MWVLSDHLDLVDNYGRYIVDRVYHEIRLASRSNAWIGEASPSPITLYLLPAAVITMSKYLCAGHELCIIYDYFI